MASPRPLPLPNRGPLGRLTRRQNVTPLVLGVIALLLAALIARDVFFPAAANTAAKINTAVVGLGNVSSSVSGSGQLVPARQTNLGFKSAGTLTEVDVHSGDKVSAGQVLARIDPTNLQVALQQAQATLTMAQATLAQTQSGTTLQQASDALNQARQSYNNAVSNQNTDQAQLSTDQASYWYGQYQPTYAFDRNELTLAEMQYAQDGCTAYGGAQPAPCSNDLKNIQAWQNHVSCVQGNGLAGCSTDETQISMAYKAVNADQAKVNADVLQVQSAQNQLTNAQDGYNNQAVNRPAQIQQQQAAVSSAQASVTAAQANLDAATLTAPFDGVISSITAQVGDAVSATTSSTGAEAPGSTALLPSGGSSSGSASSGAGSAFMTLISAGAYQAVISFAESDAAKIQSGQTAQLTFDAISGLAVTGKVLAVAAAPTVVSNVVNYYVTISLDAASSRLRDGLTTNASVVTANASNVLRIPNSAIRRLGQLTYVLLQQGGKQVQQVVTLGVAGDQYTQVMNGLQAGDKVVLPSVRSASTTSGAARGLGGGGGVFVGGGGGGR